MGAAVGSVARGMAAASRSLGDSNKCKRLHSAARWRQLRSVGSLAPRSRERTEEAAAPLVPAPAGPAPGPRDGRVEGNVRQGRAPLPWRRGCLES